MKGTKRNRPTTVKVIQWRKQDGEFSYPKPITGNEREMRVAVPIGRKADLQFCVAEMEAAHTDFYFSLNVKGVDLLDNGISGILTRSQLLALPEALEAGFREARKIGLLG